MSLDHQQVWGAFLQLVMRNSVETALIDESLLYLNGYVPWWMDDSEMWKPPALCAVCGEQISPQLLTRDQAIIRLHRAAEKNHVIRPGGDWYEYLPNDAPDTGEAGHGG